MKRFLIPLTGISILLILFFTYKDSQIILDQTRNRSFVEQYATKTVGYDNGIPVFKIDINKIRQENYKHILIAEEIVSGSVFNADSKKVITNLSGNYGRINTNIKFFLLRLILKI